VEESRRFEARVRSWQFFNCGAIDPLCRGMLLIFFENVYEKKAPTENCTTVVQLDRKRTISTPRLHGAVDNQT